MKKRWVVLAFIIYTLLIFIPPIIYQYSYPNHGVDSYYHIQRIIGIEQGIPQQVVYWGDYIVGYPLIALKHIFGIAIETSFMWFSFLMLWLVGVSCYLLISLLFNQKCGLVAMILMFASPSIWNLYDTGAIYDLMTVGIIMPLLLFGVIKIIHKKWIYVIPMVILSIMAVTLHSMGILGTISQVSNGSIPKEPTMSAQPIISFIGTPIIVLGSFILGYCAREWRNIGLKVESKIVLISLSAMTLLFLLLGVIGITGFSIRFGINMAITLSILVMCLTGIFITIEKDKITTALITLSSLTGSIPILLTYYGLR